MGALHGGATGVGANGSFNVWTSERSERNIRLAAYLRPVFLLLNHHHRQLELTSLCIILKEGKEDRSSAVI